MKNLITKYWYLAVITLIIINILGFCLAEVKLNISDALVHAESDKVISDLNAKDFLYTIFIDLVLILDFAIALFAIYFIGKKIIQSSKK